MAGPTESGAGDLGRRFLRGSMYLGAGNWLTYALNFALNLAIARLLGPTILGFYAFVFSINEILNVVGAFSVGLALLQSREESDELYDSALALSAGIGAVGLVMAAVAAPVLYHYRGPDAAWFILILGGCRVLTLLSQIYLVKLERQLRYAAVAGIGIVSGIVPTVMAVFLALGGLGAWSLIARDALAAVLNLGLSRWRAGHRFGRRVRRAAIGRIMDFARPMFVSRTLEIALSRTDRFLVGAWLGDRTLGLYHQARYLAETGLLAIRPVTRLTFNLYARLQDQPDRLARSYGLVNYFLVRAVFAGSAVLLAFPTETIRLLLGEEWVGAAPVLRWLALYAGLLPVFENMKTLLIGRGNVRANVTLRAVQLAVLLPGVVIAVALGSVEGVAALLLVTSIVGTGLAMHFNRDVVAGSLVDLLGVPALALALSAGGLVWASGAGALDGLPYWLLPFLAPPAFGALLLTAEGPTLVRNFRYLRRIGGAA